MSRTEWSPGTVPYGADQTVYVVVDRFGSGSVAIISGFTT